MSGGIDKHYKNWKIIIHIEKTNRKLNFQKQFVRSIEGSFYRKKEKYFRYEIYAS